jgi:hypothetical protein
VSKKVSTKNLVALPKPGKSKLVVRVLLIVALVLIIRDPIGSAMAVQHASAAISAFLDAAGGGPR